jgi:dihydrofolate synthase/folylpolyglutamate synthase
MTLASIHSQHEAVALAFLDSLDISAMKLGLSRIRAVLETRGNPQNKLPMVHIAGTNGKGSTTAMLSSILQSAGLKTGRFISPHLVSVRERIVINGRAISPEDFASTVCSLKAHLEALQWPHEEWPTYFEALNIIAYQYFVAEDVQMSVFETGLGGRLDSTNVVARPDLTVITSIGLDHTQHLGDTLAKIAEEKAGILKPGVPLVLGAKLPSEARRVILDRAEALAVPVIEVDANRFRIDKNRSSTEEGLILEETATGEHYRLPLAAPYQRDNAALALACVTQLQQQGMAISQCALKEGFAQTYWPARFQSIAEESLIVDGSHNADGFASLAEALQLYYSGRPLIWLLSLRNNRSPEALVDLLSHFPEPQGLIITMGQPTQLYHPPKELANILTQALKARFTAHANAARPFCQAIEDPIAALTALRAIKTELDQPVLSVITGSLYTAGAILEVLGLDEISKQN